MKKIYSKTKKAMNYGEEGNLLFSSDLANSLKRAEKDYKAGRIHRVKSLRDLRK